MNKVKLNLGKLTVAEKLLFARQIITAMTDNANFPTPDPTIASVTASADELEEAANEFNVAHQDALSKLSAVDDKEYALNEILIKLSRYVENASNGNETIIQTSGMSIRVKPAPVGQLSPPISLEATVGEKDGQIDLSWNPVYGAKSYIIEVSPDPITATSWKHATVSTKSRANVSGLNSGTKYWFRVSALGAAGQSGWSDPATKYAP